MSLVNPETRWWNRDAPRRVGAYVLWAIALTLTLVGVPTLALGEASPLPQWVGISSSFVPLLLLLAGEFLIMFGTNHEHIYTGRIVGTPLAAYFLAMGLAFVAGDVYAGTIGHSQNPWMLGQGLLFALGGVVAIAAIEIFRARSIRRTGVQQRVQRSGVRTTAVITRARTYSVNYQPVTRVTARFTDDRGRDRWASDTLPGEIRVGERVDIRYSPDDLGRQGAVILG